MVIKKKPAQMRRLFLYNHIVNYHKHIFYKFFNNCDFLLQNIFITFALIIIKNNLKIHFMAKMTPAGKIVILLLFIGIGVGSYKLYRNKHPELVTSNQESVETQKKVDIPESTLALCISGSSVINDDLSPAAVKAFMESQNYTDIQTIQVNKKEKSILGKLDGKLIRFDIKSPGTKDGFEALKTNKADICMASAQGEEEFRNITTENVIGLDGIAVVSNQNNIIKFLSKEDLEDIFSGKITDWGNVPGSKITGAIKIYRMGDKTGIYKMFKDLVMHSKDITGTSFDKSKEMVDAVSKDGKAIGFVSYTFLQNSSGIKEIAISDTKGIPPISPNALTIASEKYPLCRRLYMYRPTVSNNATASSFARFIASAAGQKIVEGVGFINLSINNDNPVEISSTDPTEYINLINNSKKITTEFRFKTGSQELDSRGLDDVDRLVSYLSQPIYRNKTITLVGFTDNTGNPDKNKILSRQRAASVEKILSIKGVNISNTIGMGILRPARENSTEQNRALNRRVEIWIKK